MAQENSQTWTWGYRFSYTDSLGGHYQGVHRLTECFPGILEIGKDIESAEVEIYKRNGQMVFETNRLDENWICADADTFLWEEGIYVCMMTLTIPQDTVNETVALYIYKHPKPSNDTVRNEEGIEAVYPVKRIHKDSTVKVNKEEYLFLIQKGIQICEKKEIESFDTYEHILIIMLLNSGQPYWVKQDAELLAEFEKFTLKMDLVNYAKKAGALLEWRPNKGMGMYFTKFDIEFGGSPQTKWGYLELKNN